MEDLIEACNEALYEFSGVQDGVKRRQVFNDILFMESEQGWSIPLERIKDGRRIYYRYEDKAFSIINQGINQSEAEQLQNTLYILSRFSGLPAFDWVDEIQVRIQDTFKLNGKVKKAVGFEQNPYLKGLEYFTELFNAIQNEVCLVVRYQGFRQNEATDVQFHPWYLKQFNSRWFVFGYNEKYENLMNMALDRILSLTNSKEDYIPNSNIDFDEYFEDVVGVTVDEDCPVEVIKLKINGKLWPYIDSKPIHGSQRVLKKTDDYILIELELRVNYEFISLLFSYQDGVEVIAPEGFRERILTIIERMNDNYF